MRIFVVLILAFCGFVSGPAAAQARPGQFVAELGERVVGILEQELPEGERHERLKALFIENFADEAIARALLGPYAREITPEQWQEYLGLLRELVAQIYAGRFAEYSGEQFEVTAERAAGSDTLVEAHIVRPDGPDIPLSFRVRESDGGLLVHDIAVEGVSLIITKRAEFSSVLSREGIEGLLDRLRRQVSA